MLVIFLGACGFRPLYGQKNSASSRTAEENLGLIEVKSINDRIGQQLHNNLLVRLNPHGPSDRPAYSLSISVLESISNLGVKKSSVVTRGNLRVTATYSLSGYNSEDLGGQSLTSGTIISTSSYDIPQAQYTALAAAKDARARAVREIADDIRTRLAVYFQQATD